MTAPRWRLALSLQASLSQASWVGVRIMVGYQALALQADPLLLAVLAACFAVPTIVAALPIGRVSDRIGGSSVATCGLIVAGTGTTTILLLQPTVATLILGTLVVGLGHLCVMVGQQTYVAHASRGGSHDSGFGTLAAAASIGQLIGPSAVTIGSTLHGATRPDVTVGLAVCVGFTLAALPMIFVLHKGDAHRRATTAPQTRPRVREVLRAPELWKALTASGAVLVTVDLLYTFVPLWAVDRNIPASAVGLLLSLRALISVFSRLGLGRLVGRFGRKPLLVTSMLVGVASLVALPFCGTWGAIPVMVGLGIALGVPQPLTMAWTTAITPPTAHGAALGLRLTANRIAQVAIPLGVGAIAGPLGLISVFWANAVVLALGAAVALSARTTERGDDV
ncbi:MFS transporter [Microbacterium sp. NPDC058342]|uniref:MFS transporter n=1 Tax=Microbacterium sp. NPDC058342 TaxID=3346454 RepID=UPI00366A1578